MPARAQNVFPLNAQRRSSRDLPVAMKRLGVAVQELDDLRCHVEQILNDPCWSALEWRAVGTPLMLKLAGARQSLADLADIEDGQWPDIGWAIRLTTARDEVERRLREVSTSMSALTHRETSSVDAVIGFGCDGTGLAKAADELRGLIVSQYPETIGAI